MHVGAQNQVFVDVVEAHCYVTENLLILAHTEQIQPKTADCVGRYDYVGLCQLRTKQFCKQLTKANVSETSCSQWLLIESATFMLKINLLAIKSFFPMN